jgi:4-amino-4-deoxy-L-arabinose transferase-like glycosyltransferase
LVNLQAERIQRTDLSRNLILLFLLALATRAAAVLIYSLRHDVYFEYMLIAQNLNQGLGYSLAPESGGVLQPTSLFPPLYVYGCAFFMGLWPTNFLGLYLAQAIVAASGVIPAFLVTRKLFSPRAGYIAAALYAIFPELIFATTRPVPESLFVVGGLWILYLYLQIADEPPESRGCSRPLLGFAILSGAMLLLKESSLMIIGAAIVALLWKRRHNVSAILHRTVWILAIVAVILSPWIARNWIVQDRLIVLRTGYGMNLWIGNNIAATGSDRTVTGDFLPDSLPLEYGAYIRDHLPADEQARDDFYLREALSFVRDYPVRYLELCAHRLWYMLAFVPMHPLAQNGVYKLSYLVLLVLALPSLFLLIRRRALDPFFPWLFAATLAMYVPVLVQPRYRIFLVTCLLLLVSDLLSRLSLRRNSGVAKP